MPVASIKRALPLWANLVIAFTLVFLFAAYSAGIWGIFAIRQAHYDSLNLDKIKRVAAGIGEFPDPLPEGFRYVNGLHISFFKEIEALTLEHQPDKQQISIFATIENTALDPKKLLDGALDESPFRALADQPKFQEVKERGETQIASVPMPYIVGETVGNSGRRAMGMVGCLQPKVKDGVKRILIYALQTSDVPYNQDTTLKLLNSIKGF